MSKPVHTDAGPVTVSRHAIERYIERVKPAFSYGHALYELARLLPQAEVHRGVPCWLGENPAEDTDFYLVLCDSVAFPVRGSLATTCIARGTFGPVQRAVRSQHNKWRRRHVRAQEQKQRSQGARRQRKRDQKRTRFTDLGEAA